MGGPRLSRSLEIVVPCARGDGLVAHLVSMISGWIEFTRMR